MNINITGKNALICGSSKGIGLAIAQELALSGANCTLISRSEESLKIAVATLEASKNQQHDYLIADFNHYEQVKNVVTRYVEKKDIQILINNSGGPAGGLITEAKPEAFLEAFQQHLICNQVITKAILPGMKSSSYGRIINIISTSVKIPLKGLGVSNTIRGAVASWSKTMANELGVFGITVNNVLPGATATARLDTIFKNKMTKTGKSKEEIEAAMLAEIPMNRFAQPSEIAAMAAFLASPAAGYITGVSIPVDGGRTGSL